MAKIKAVLRRKKNKWGEYPIAIRIAKGENTSYIYLGHTVREELWDKKEQRVKKGHPNATRLNNLILKKIAEVNDQALDFEIQKKRASSKSIKEKAQGSTKESSFFRYAEQEYLKNLEDAGKFNRVSAERPRINRFKEFLKGESITFQEISIPLLRRFMAYLKRTRTINDRTVINHLIVIRTIFNQAINANLVERSFYPFGKKGIQIKFPESVKVGLVKEELETLENIDLNDNPAQDHARNVWLLSFYFAGMRVSDVLLLRWPDFQDGRLYYTMGKNQKAGSIPIPSKAQALLEKYHGHEYPHDLVFPELAEVDDLKNKYLVQQKIAVATAKFNKRLKTVAEKAKIEKNLTMHIARHTFGNLSGDKISLQMLQRLYRHSHITTTVNYQANFMFKDIDEALEKVIG